MFSQRAASPDLSFCRRAELTGSVPPSNIWSLPNADLSKFSVRISDVMLRRHSLLCFSCDCAVGIVTRLIAQSPGSYQTVTFHTLVGQDPGPVSLLIGCHVRQDKVPLTG